MEPISRGLETIKLQSPPYEAGARSNTEGRTHLAALQVCLPVGAPALVLAVLQELAAWRR